MGKIIGFQLWGIEYKVYVGFRVLERNTAFNEGKPNLMRTWQQLLRLLLLTHCSAF